MAKEKKPKKKRPFDLHTFLIGKLRAATRKCEPFNKVLAAAKVQVFGEYIEKPDGTKWLKATVKEDKFNHKIGDEIWVQVYKKLPSCDRIMYHCAECQRLFFSHEHLPSKKGGFKHTAMTAIDHVEPVVGVEGFVDWNQYISRMFEGKLQILCGYPGEREGKKSCHAIKTADESTRRAEYKARKIL